MWRGMLSEENLTILNADFHSSACFQYSVLFLSLSLNICRKQGSIFCQIGGAHLGSSCFLYKFISHPLFQPCNPSPELQKSQCLNSYSFPAFCSWTWHPHPLQAVGFRFACPTKSVTIHPSAFHLPKFCGYLSSVGIFLNLFIFMGLQLKKKFFHCYFTSVSDRSGETWGFPLTLVTHRSIVLTFQSVS